MHERKTALVTIALLLLILIAVFIWSVKCSRDELREPGEYRSFSVNMLPGVEPTGYLDWKWDSPMDSIIWTEHGVGKTNLSELVRRNPDWMIVRKSGNILCSVNLLPSRYRTMYGITFNQVHLFFKPERGLVGWQSVTSDNPFSTAESFTRAVYHVLEDSLRKEFGEPHELNPKNLRNGNKRVSGLLWKGKTAYMTLILYSHEGGSLSLFNDVRAYTR